MARPLFDGDTCVRRGLWEYRVLPPKPEDS